MRRIRRTTGLLTSGAAALLVLAACAGDGADEGGDGQGFGECLEPPNACNSPSIYLTPSIRSLIL